MIPSETDILRAAIKDQNARIEGLKGNLLKAEEECSRLARENTTLKTFVKREFPELDRQAAQASTEAFPPEFDTEEVAALLIKTVREKEGQTVGQIAKLMNLTTNQTSTLLMMLRKQGIIRSEGARRGTRYFMA